MFTQHKKLSFRSSAVLGGILAAFVAGWMATESAFSTWIQEGILPPSMLTATDPMEIVPPDVVEEDRRFLETVMHNQQILSGPALSSRR